MSRFALGAVLSSLILPMVASADVSPNPAELAISDADLARAKVLIKKLASPAFPERDRAMRELRRMGRRALDVIAPAVEAHPDPEVRFRCERLLPAARADDIAARLSTFIADVEGRYEHDLPGWSQFQEIVGGDRVARKTFTSLLNDDSNRVLVAAVDDDPEDLATHLADRLMELRMAMYPRFLPPGGQRYKPTAEDAITVVFAETILGENTPAAVRGGIPASTLVQQSTFRTAFGQESQREVLEKLVVRWLDTRPGPNGLVQAMSISSSLNLDSAPKYLLKVIAAADVPATTRASAATTLARKGGIENIAHLTPLFECEDVIRRVANQEPVQLRDVALAMAVILAGKEPKDVGLIAQSTSSSRRYYYSNYRFASEDDRTKGFEQWKAIAAKLADQ